MTATAIGNYAILVDLKRRLSITDSTDDTELQQICDWANAGVESCTHRAIASTVLTAAVFDGYAALENGRLMTFEQGIRSITSLEVATNTGASFVTVPTTDYFIRPVVQQRDPGWPGTELWMTDIPSATNTLPYFPPGFANVRITGTGGWAAQPDDVIAIALNAGAGFWRGRGAAGVETFTIGADGERTFSRSLSYADRQTLNRYRYRPVEII